MPRSSVGMSEYDGNYYFDIDKYLIKNYPTMTKPARRALCSKVQSEIDTDTIEELVDAVVLQYALEQQGWYTPDEDDDE